MSVFPLNIPEKINTPELLAFFQQFGLDKYLSAEEINKMTAGLAELKEASGNVAIINTIFVNNSFTKIGQIFKGNAGTQWNINGLNYTNPTYQEITIPLCAIGKERTDRIVLDTNNNFVLVQGVEVTANPVAQSKPVNTLDYTFIPVNDSLVGVPTSPIVGSDVVKKSFANMFEFNGTGANSIIPLHPSGYSEIRLINAALTSVSGVDLSLMTGPNFESPYQGKPIIFWNRTGGDVTLNNEDYAIADYPLFLTQGSNLIFPHNHFVIFKWDSAGLYQVDKNFFSIDEIIGLTTALSLKADLVAGKVPSAQLPSYVDDVLEFANLADFPVSGEASKIYLALDNNLTYRWSGSAYVDLNSSKLNKVSTVDVEKVYVKNADGTQGMKPTSELGGKRVQIISDCSSWQLNANLFFVTTESVNGVGWNSGNTFKSSQPGATSNAISLITNAFVIPIGISAYNSNLKKLVLEARHSYYRPNDRFLIGYYQKNSASPVTHINPTIIYDNIVPYGETSDGTYVVLNINSNILIPENAMIVYAIASNDATAAATVNKFYCLTTQIILEEI